MCWSHSIGRDFGPIEQSSEIVWEAEDSYEQQLHIEGTSLLRVKVSYPKWGINCVTSLSAPALEELHLRRPALLVMQSSLHKLRHLILDITSVELHRSLCDVVRHDNLTTVTLINYKHSCFGIDEDYEEVCFNPSEKYIREVLKIFPASALKLECTFQDEDVYTKVGNMIENLRGSYPDRPTRFCRPPG